MRGIPLDEWHKRMWEQLQEGKTRTKMSFILETFNEVGDVALKSVMILKSCCFACLYDSILFTGTCKLCPIGSCTQNGCLDGLYLSYVSAKNEKDRCTFANQIANLEWNGIKILSLNLKIEIEKGK